MSAASHPTGTGLHPKDPAAWMAPWDHSWVTVHTLTRPMFITLYDAAIRGGTDMIAIRRLYPGGQSRLIMAGLYRRGLIEHPINGGGLTACGLVLAVWARCAVERAYPTRPNEVRTR